MDSPASGSASATIPSFVIPGEETPVGWIPPADLTLEEWGALGPEIGKRQRATRWLLGDWLNYGERRYGETYAQYMDATGHKYQYLADARWVAGAVEFSSREERLSWSHHRLVAKLSRDEQRYWLRLAVAEDWTYDQLREAIAPEAADPEAGEIPLDGQPDHEHIYACTVCGEVRE